MLARAYAKINWALDVVGRSADGYHMLDMLMQSVELCDEISIETSESLELYGDGGDKLSDDNLVTRAANALRERAGIKDGARITLKKRIPERAGLGGGSADCAATLKALNEFWSARLDIEALQALGLTLGADVPYCIAGGLKRARGIGEALEKIEGAPDKPVPIVILMPEDGLSTRDVFDKFDCDAHTYNTVDIGRAANALVNRDFAALRIFASNALQAPATALMPEIAENIAALYGAGATYAAMTGSGSAAFGAFETAESAIMARDALGMRAIYTATKS